MDANFNGKLQARLLCAGIKANLDSPLIRKQSSDATSEPFITFHALVRRMDAVKAPTSD